MVGQKEINRQITVLFYCNGGVALVGQGEERVECKSKALD